jgi:hypothetical protein
VRKRLGLILSKDRFARERPTIAVAKRVVINQQRIDPIALKFLGSAFFGRSRPSVARTDGATSARRRKSRRREALVC